MVIVIHFPMRANGAILPKHFVVIGTGLSFFLAWANHDMGDGKHGDETSNFLRSPKSQKKPRPHDTGWWNRIPMSRAISTHNNELVSIRNVSPPHISTLLHGFCLGQLKTLVKGGVHFLGWGSA